ncbi:hypothetical protein M8C21_010942 [Ambrosia artemisiifolia]|uniref:Protein kinase domain-containing protein n=1 Tax=Ambrosia artemisiifolia TaxID=4212 RepID=A0AAD5G1Z1_AMBAR|nr:hypothetical protein M8C21_010942 [Ambrosia artemisiifolia]
MIGKGGSSRVYKGRLPDGKEIAVKILKSTEDVLKEFVLEIEIINALHHQNIISLFGFCFEDINLLLVYDFLSRGSLEDNLHGNKKDFAFRWNERYKVAVGIAEALIYQHNSCDPTLSDFGLAVWAATTSAQITYTDVAGNFGYLALEYFMYGKVTDKIDVYAFGVVLLELLSGRKPISIEYPKGEESLVIWGTLPTHTKDESCSILNGSTLEITILELETMAADSRNLHGDVEDLVGSKSRLPRELEIKL